MASVKNVHANKAESKQILDSTAETLAQKNNEEKLPKDIKDEIKAESKQILDSTAETLAQKNNEEKLPKDIKDEIKAESKQILDSTAETLAQKNNEEKLPKDIKDEIKAESKQILDSTAETLAQKNNEEKLPKDIKDEIKDGFSWKVIAGFKIPCITRLVDGKQLEFVSTQIAEYRLLKKYLRNVHSDIYTTCTSVRGYVITDLEAKILNYIIKKHYGKDIQFFAGKDYIVLLEDFFNFYIFLEVCYTKLLCNNVSSYKDKCGFIFVDSVSVIPYCTVGGQKYVPLFFFEDDTKTLINYAEKLVNWNLAYLKFCCKLAGIKDKWFASDHWTVVNFDHIKNLLPPETNFNDFWPTMLSDSFLFTRQKSIRQNPPGSWFKVLPEVVTDEKTLKAPVVPQRTEVMTTQMLQQEQQQQEVITIPLTQSHDNSNKPAYKIQITSLEGKMIYCINAKPCMYSDFVVTLKELVQMVLPLCNVAKCAHILYKYLKITLLFGNSEQLAVLLENKLIRSMNPADTPMVMLQDIKEILPLLKKLVSMQDEAIEQYLSVGGPFKSPHTG